MNELLEGNVYRLGSVMEITGYQGYILMEEDAYTGKDSTVIDLGLRRKLIIPYTKAYLILVNNHVSRAKEFSGKNNKLSTILSDMGINAKTKAGYSKGKNAWHYAIGKGPNSSVKGIFGKYGYAVQEKIWADCWEFDFSMRLFNPGWVRIGGVNTDWLSTSHWVLDDVMDKGSKLIRTALTKEVDISEEKYRKVLKKAGLEESLFMD